MKVGRCCQAFGTFPGSSPIPTFIHLQTRTRSRRAPQNRTGRGWRKGTKLVVFSPKTLASLGALSSAYKRGGDSDDQAAHPELRRLPAGAHSRGDGGRVVAVAGCGDPGARGRPGLPHQAAARRGAAPQGGARAGEELRRGLRLRARLHLQADAQEGRGLLQGPHPGDLRHRLRRLRARRLRRRLRAHRLRQPAPGAQLERRLPQEVPERVPQALLNPHVVAVSFPL